MVSIYIYMVPCYQSKKPMAFEPSQWEAKPAKPKLENPMCCQEPQHRLKCSLAAVLNVQQQRLHLCACTGGCSAGA